jgi:hypothetical protein
VSPRQPKTGATMVTTRTPVQRREACRELAILQRETVDSIASTLSTCSNVSFDSTMSKCSVRVGARIRYEIDDAELAAVRELGIARGDVTVREVDSVCI